MRFVSDMSFTSAIYKSVAESAMKKNDNELERVSSIHQIKWIFSIREWDRRYQCVKRLEICSVTLQHHSFVINIFCVYIIQFHSIQITPSLLHCCFNAQRLWVSRAAAATTNMAISLNMWISFWYFFQKIFVQATRLQEVPYTVCVSSNLSRCFSPETSETRKPTSSCIYFHLTISHLSPGLVSFCSISLLQLGFCAPLVSLSLWHESASGSHREMSAFCYSNAQRMHFPTARHWWRSTAWHQSTANRQLHHLRVSRSAQTNDALIGNIGIHHRVSLTGPIEAVFSGRYKRKVRQDSS